MPLCACAGGDGSFVQRFRDSREAHSLSLPLPPKRAHQVNRLGLARAVPKGFAAFALPGRFLLRLTRPPKFRDKPGLLQFAEDALNLDESFPHRVFAHGSGHVLTRYTIDKRDPVLGELGQQERLNHHVPGQTVQGLHEDRSNTVPENRSNHLVELGAVRLCAREGIPENPRDREPVFTRETGNRLLLPLEPVPLHLPLRGNAKISEDGDHVFGLHPSVLAAFRGLFHNNSLDYLSAFRVGNPSTQFDTMLGKPSEYEFRRLGTTTVCFNSHN